MNPRDPATLGPSNRAVRTCLAFALVWGWCLQIPLHASAAPHARDAASGPRRVIVQFRADPSLAPGRDLADGADRRQAIDSRREQAAAGHPGVAALVRELGGRIERRFWLIDAWVVELGSDAVDALSRDPAVWRIEEDRPAYPQLFESTGVIRADECGQGLSLPFPVTGAGAEVGIADTGIDLNANQPHPNLDWLDPLDPAGDGRPHGAFYLDGNTSTDSGGIGGSRILSAVDMETREVSCPYPDTPEAIAYRKGGNGYLSHGASVAGIVLGASWSAASPPSDWGVAPEALLRFYKIADDDSMGANSWESTMVATIEQAVLDQVKVFNMSYSGFQDAANAFNRAVDAAGYMGDVVVCCAAANSGPTPGSVSHNYRNGFIVASCSDLDDSIANYSARGPLEGRPVVHISAPGSNGAADTVAIRLDDEGSSAGFGGTSAASPHVAGAAALIRQADPAASALEVKALLMHTAADISAANPGLDENAFGVGRLDVYAGVLLAVQSPSPVLSGTVTTPGELFEVATCLVAPVQETKITLVWNKKDDGTGIPPALSDLDLRVLDDALNPVASSLSRVNEYEIVRFIPPGPGTYRVQVTAEALPEGDQEFTLVGVVPSALAAAGEDRTVCRGDAVRIGTPVLPAFVAAWEPPDGLDFPDSDRPMASPGVTTTYTLTLTDPSNGCSSEDTVTVFVVEPPGAVSSLLAAREGSNVRLRWNRVDEALGGYHAYEIQGKKNIPAGKTLGRRVIDTPEDPGAVEDVDSGALDRAPDLFFYQVYASCPRDGTQGP